jgi:hypothetical protein
MIPPDAQRAMAKRARATVVEIKGSHAVYVSQAQAVTSLIEQAVTASIAAVDGQAKSLNVRSVTGCWWTAAATGDAGAAIQPASSQLRERRRA